MLVLLIQNTEVVVVSFGFKMVYIALKNFASKSNLQPQRIFHKFKSYTGMLPKRKQYEVI